MSKRKSAPKGCFWRNGSLWARIQIRGRDYKRRLDTDDPQVAGRRARQWREQLTGAVRFGEQPRRTFQSVLDAWGPWIVRQVGPRTALRYGSSLGTLEPFLADRFLDEIDGRLVGEIIQGRQAQVTNATVKRDLVALSSVIGFAIDRGWTEANPVLARMKRLKERRDPIVLPDPADIAKVIARAPGQFAALIEAAWRTGARQEELAGAMRAQFSDARRELTIRGKGNKVRVIDLEPFGAIEIFRRLPLALGTAPLFWHGSMEPAGKRPIRYANVASRFRALCVELAKADPQFRPFRFHDLRHAHAVDWLRSGRSIYALSARLGHGSVKTTEIYLRYVTAEQAAQAKAGAGR